jgi:hypothetical protein
MEERRRQNPYREEDAEVAERKARPREFIYATDARRSRRRGWKSPWMLLLVAFFLLLLSALGIGRPGFINLAPAIVALVLLLVAVALADLIPKRGAVHRSSKKDGKEPKTGLLLRVIGGDLEIREKTPAAESPVLRTRLRDVRDVRLDTRHIRKVESAVEAGQFMSHRVGPELDVARIQLLIEGRDGPVPLTEAFGAHMDAMEWMGKIRTFLRANDWVPEDERTRLTVDSEDEEVEHAAEKEEDEEAAAEEEGQPEGLRRRMRSP